MRRIALVLVLLVVTGCGGTYGWTGAPAPMTNEGTCSGKAAPHTPAEVAQRSADTESALRHPLVSARMVSVL